MPSLGADRLVQSLTIVIVTWNSADILRPCLETIQHAIQDDFRLDEVVIVDNGSSDVLPDSAIIGELPIRIIRNRHNVGFGRACNQGSVGVSSDYLLFLNPDTMLQEDSLSGPIQFLEENSQYGVCGIQLVDSAGKVSRTCARFPTPVAMFTTALGLDRVWPRAQFSIPMRDWDHQSTAEVEHVIGAFYLIRRSLFEALDGFDERYFVYFEDLDLSLRVRESGWSIGYLATVCAFHEGGGSSKRVKAIRQYYSSRSRIEYSRKHYNSIASLLCVGAICILEPVARVISALASQEREVIKDILGATWLLWRRVLIPRLMGGPAYREGEPLT